MVQTLDSISTLNSNLVRILTKVIVVSIYMYVAAGS